MAECLANHAGGTYPCGHIRLRRRLSQRYEADCRLPHPRISSGICPGTISFEIGQRKTPVCSGRDKGWTDAPCLAVLNKKSYGYSVEALVPGTRGWRPEKIRAQERGCWTSRNSRVL